MDSGELNMRRAGKNLYLSKFVSALKLKCSNIPT